MHLATSAVRGLFVASILAAALSQGCIVTTNDPSCPVGQLACNGVCAATSSDFYNCGGCGLVCPSGYSCTSSVCVAPAGSLVVTWDINGSTDPAACTARNAATIRIRVFSAGGVPYGSATGYEQACSSFSTSVLANSIAPGTYTLQAELYDSVGNKRTTTIGAPPAAPVTINVSSGLTTKQALTFPDASFL